ncbi:ATPase-like protein [Anaeromyxobacter dehalogenans 2CP-1]|uniref:ATPase-like protein n=1 Tax=Anaeromyxobacter dehalogenans (strain ATCC BAA-258 / DSM 21875 / 2CP-1) TaxID=455488 RepID=B8J702_ANAD2|nr:ATPase-like protein [Anaeromyxobacter dehalogenans 2CP-1]
MNAIRACIRAARMIKEEGAVPLVGYVPPIPKLEKTGIDDYFVNAQKRSVAYPKSYNPLEGDFADARPVGPNELIEWLVEQKDEAGWERDDVLPELRRAAIWARVWHERERRAWHAWTRRAAKTFFVGQDEIEQMVAHLGLAQRDEPKASSWNDFDDGKILEHCVPILNHAFRLLVDRNGTERIFQVNDRNEATLQQSNANIHKALHDALKAEFGTVPPARLLEASNVLWKKETARLAEEPEPFCFAGDDRVCFKRFDWKPAEAPFPAWEEFLTRLSDREAFMAFVWSCFEKKNRSRQYLWLRGEGQDGKSKVLGVLLEVFGPAGAAINNSHVEKGNQFFFSALYGKRLVIYPDCKNAKFGMKEIVRNCTSGDPVAVEFKGETPFTTVLRIRLFVASNTKPEFTSQAADRSRIIYVEVAESASKDDPTWEERLKAQLPGFLWSCKATYERVCAHHGDIPVSEQTKAMLDEAAVAFEEQFHDIFDAHFSEAPGEAAPAKPVATILRGYGMNNNQINDFKAWMGRVHRVVYRPRKDGRVYEGLAFLPSSVR